MLPSMTTQTETKPDGVTRTTYWDEKDSRWVHIVKRGSLVKHHKLPRTVIESEDALAYVTENDLGLT